MTRQTMGSDGRFVGRTAGRTIVMFGTYDETMHPRVAVLAESMVAAGHSVIRCNAPISLSTADRIRLLRQPWRLPGAALGVLRCWWRLVRNARSIGRSAPDAVIVGYLGVFDVHLARLCFSCPILLDNMAPVGGIARDRGLRFAGLLDLLDRAAQWSADLVIADTEEHLPQQAGSSAVVRVGSPERWFAARRPPTDIGDDLSVAFFGLFTPLQGTAVIAEAIARLGDDAGITWTLIGDGQDRDAAAMTVGSSSAVRWIDWLGADALARTVGEHDVCLGIFGGTPKAARVVPNKVFQGAAAGCALITSETAPQRRALGDAAVFVPVADADALVAAIERLRDDRGERIRLRAAAGELADREFSPSAMAAQVDAAIDLAVSARVQR